MSAGVIQAARWNHPFPDVLDSCRVVLSQAPHVSIDSDAIARRASLIDAASLVPPECPEPFRFHGDREACANFTLLCDCLNFCFWSERPWVVRYAGREWTRTFAMLAGMHRAIAEDRAWLDARRWRDATEPDVRRMFHGEGEIPLVPERVRVLNETGDKLLSAYGGQFAKLIEHAGFDALTVAQTLARDFESFRDVAEYRGRPVAFLKRAQICAADLSALWTTERHGSLSGLEGLTMFADYRLPQLFRHWGVLRLTPELEARIERRELIPAGSEQEVEIRAATIVIGDALAHATGVPAWRLDYHLWDASHSAEVAVEHHRTPTIYY